MLVELGVVEQRTKAVYEVLDGATVTDVAMRYGVTRQTVHRWLRRFANEGFSALIDKSSKPAGCPHQMPAVVEAKVVEMRREHPEWGPRTILYYLTRDGVNPLPGRSSVHRALVRHGLITPHPRRRKKGDYRRWERSSPMELWQMDLVGRFHLKGGTELKCLTGIDDHSRYCVSARLMVRATARPVGEAFKRALRTHGVPRQVLSDNGSVFTARFSGGPGPVLFDKICADNGIDHILTAPYSPTTTGKVERFHRTLRREFFSKNDYRFETIEEAQQALDAFVHTYNTERPHQSIGDRPPAERFSLRIEPELDVIDTDLGEVREEDLHPAAVTRRVGQDGCIRLEGVSYRTRHYLVGEVVEVYLARGLVEICHRGEIVATHARMSRNGKPPRVTNEPRRIKARDATVGMTVVRVVDASGSVSFAGWPYRVGNAFIGMQVEVAIVGGKVQISHNGALVKLHPIRHDRAKEHGAFSRPMGKPASVTKRARRATG